MHFLDIILGILLLILALKYMSKGFVASFIQLIGLIVIVYAIAKAGRIVKLLVIEQLGWSNTISTIIAYILIALIILLIIKLIIFLMNRVVDFLNLKWLNKLLGAVFGVLNGLLLIAIIIIIADMAPFKKQIREFSNRSYIVRNLRIITNEIEMKYPYIGEYKKPLQEKLEGEFKRNKETLEDKAEEVL
ncbi:MAG: hypothetical protein APR54_03885 [Candidatus Cloacimonas sp. SDB]|nr:MAG: hypothetical protein APR54_03885 [Candidatus Cloacimonas sp. SDB]